MTLLPADSHPIWSPRVPTAGSATLPSHAEALVVGAGVTGLSTAIELARAGRSPVVVDALALGQGTTGHSSAKLSVLQGSMLQRLRKHVADETVRAYLDANLAGQAWLIALMLRRGVSFDVRTAVTYAVTKQGAKAVASEREASAAVGLGVGGVDGLDLPVEVLDAISLQEQVQINPVATLQAMRDELLEFGGRLVEGVRVTGCSDESPWRVETTSGEIVADVVVEATQVPVLGKSLHGAMAQANRSYVLAYPADQRWAELPMGLSLDEETRSFRTATLDGGLFLLIGGAGHPVGEKGSVAEHVARLDRWARETFGVGEPSHSWSAQDYRLPTQIPSVGPIRGTDDTILVATGFDKWGMANGAAAGQVLAGEILGEVPAFADGLHSDGVGAHDVASVTKKGLGTVGHMLGDRAAVVLGSSDGDPAEGEGRLEGSPSNPVAASTVGGRTCRVSGVCTHLGGILAWNDADRTWDCPLHGSRFAPSGERLEGPATAPLEEV